MTHTNAREALYDVAARAQVALIRAGWTWGEDFTVDVDGGLVVLESVWPLRAAPPLSGRRMAARQAIAVLERAGLVLEAGTSPLEALAGGSRPVLVSALVPDEV